MKLSSALIAVLGVWCATIALFLPTLFSHILSSPAILPASRIQSRIQPTSFVRTSSAANVGTSYGTNYEQLSFRTLRLYIPGRKPPQEVVLINGKSVEIMGFMSALTQLEDITEFVLASSPPMNCFCHPPLRVNEVIFVQMNKGKKTDYKGGVVKVRGRLEVNTNVSDEFADVMYTIYCEEVL
jgi:hypothetical protein